MNYTTIAEFVSRVGTDNMTDLMSLVDTAATRQTEILNEAEDLVNSYAAGKYQIPLYSTVAVTSHVVKNWVLNIAQYYAYINMEGDDIPKRVERLYATTIEQLVALSNGEINLPPGSDSTRPSVLTSGDSVSLASNTAVFDEDSMETF